MVMVFPDNLWFSETVISSCMSLKYLVILFPWGSYVKILNLPQLKRELRTQTWGLEHKQTVAEPVCTKEEKIIHSICYCLYRIVFEKSTLTVNAVPRMPPTKLLVPNKPNTAVLLWSENQLVNDFTQLGQAVDYIIVTHSLRSLPAMQINDEKEETSPTRAFFDKICHGNTSTKHYQGFFFFYCQFFVTEPW